MSIERREIKSYCQNVQNECCSAPQSQSLLERIQSLENHCQELRELINAIGSHQQNMVNVLGIAQLIKS